MYRKLVVLIVLLSAASPAFGQATSTQAQQDSTATVRQRPGLKSWTTDRRDFQVGDIVTIVVDEVTIASAEKSQVDEKDRKTNAGLGYGTGGTRGEYSFRTRLDTESAARGLARRRDVMTTELSARVVAIEPGGLVRLEGTRTLRLDKNEQKVTLTGIARAQDISANNLVDSWRLADAEILYESTGDLANPKRGILSRILSMLWP